MAILTSAADMEDIRRLVSNLLTIEDISDSAIASDVYLGEA